MKPYTLEAYKAGKKAKYSDTSEVLHVFHIPEFHRFVSISKQGDDWQHEDSDGSSVVDYGPDLIIDEADDIKEGFVNDYDSSFGSIYTNLLDAINMRGDIKAKTWHLKFNITQGTGTMEVVK